MSEFPVEVIRSYRRKRTVQASLVDGVIRVRVPAGLDAEEEQRLVAQITGKVGRKATSVHIDLQRRADQLADRYGLPRAKEVVWSSRQLRRWGACTPSDGRIRVSDRLTTLPARVLDYVLVHELAHLAVPDHGPEFAALVARYELAGRAEGYLMAVTERA